MPGAIPSSAFRRIGRDLARPECVLACASGRLYVSDKRGGVTSIDPDGTQHLIGRSTLVPNGIALCRDGAFLVANMGDEGGLWRIARDGSASAVLREVEGVRLSKVNFVTVDERDRTWVCVSARDTGDAYPVNAKTGFIAVIDGRGARIVADGLQYTNECRLAADGRHLYVNETFGRCVTRFALHEDASLHGRERIASFPGADFPDGMALDSEGGVWVVCVGSNRVHRVAPDGSVANMIDDSVPQVVERLTRAYDTDTLTRPLLTSAAGRTLQSISSLAFGGPELRTAYLGSLKGDALVAFPSPVAGLPPVHWHWN